MSTDFSISASRVLIVDDEPANIEVIQALLADQDFRFSTATSAEAALERVDTEMPELILLDIRMPGTDGVELCRLLKARPALGEVPVVFITVDQDRLADGFAAGGVDFITKPVIRDELLCRIRVHLTNYKLLKMLQAQRQELETQNEDLRDYQGMLHQEQLIADRVMTSMYSNNRSFPGLLRVHLTPQSTFSGDVVLNGLFDDGSLCLLLGDFTGHGLAAAIGTVPVSTAFYQALERQLGIGEIAREINQMLSRVIPDNMFCAATILRLSAAGQQLEVWHGGLPEGYIVEPAGCITQRITPMHMALAAEADEDFDPATEVYQLEAGSRVYLFSDGIIEAFNAADEAFGEDRLEATLQGGATDLFQETLNAVRAWRDGNDQDDDVTLIEIIAGPIPEPVAPDKGDYF